MNQLIAVGENLTYVVVEVEDNKYIVAKDLLTELQTILG
jgi:isoleucyl-tRNA synthetase